MRSIVLAVATAFGFAALAAAQDVITVGSVSGSPGATAQVPIYVRDVAGTSLGEDQIAANRIRGVAFKVSYSPSSAVSSVSFTRGGVFAAPPLYETSVPSSGAFGYVASISNSSSVPFTLNAAAPGNAIGNLQITVAADTIIGTTIVLTLDSATATLSNQVGTLTETVADASLTVANGALTITAGATETALTSSVNPSAPGQPVTFTATVSSPSSIPITGSVQFRDGGDTIGTIAVSNGQAAFTTSSLSAGMHSISAHYSGDANFEASSSSPVSQSVAAQTFGPPAGVTATAVTNSQVTVTWFAMSGVDHFDVLRSSNGNAYILAGQPASNMFNDVNVMPGVTYLYRVRAVNSAGAQSTESALDPATTITFSDDALTPGVAIKTIHVTELRTAVNAFRAAAGQGAFNFTDAISAGVTIRAIHVQQLRDALSAARAALGLSTTVTDAGLSSAIAVKALHLQELRSAVK